MEHHEHPIFEPIKSIVRLFRRRPDILELGDPAEGPAIYVANHSAANGPFTYELFFPRRFVPWGTHEMCGNYAERWHYLYDVFYQQKQGFSKLKSFLIATPFAVISRMLYRGAELIPTYRDLRLKTTIARSLEALKNGKSVLIFPENSEAVGYREVLDQFHGGFITLARRFFKQTGREVPICTVYYSGSENRMIIDRPVFLSRLRRERGLSGDGFAAFFRDRINELRLHARAECE